MERDLNIDLNKELKISVCEEEVILRCYLLPLEEQNFGDIVTPENGCLKLCIKPKCVLLITVTSERETESIGD